MSMEVVKLVPDNMEKAVKGTDFGYGRVYFDDGSSYRYLGASTYSLMNSFRLSMFEPPRFGGI